MIVSCGLAAWRCFWSASPRCCVRRPRPSPGNRCVACRCGCLASPQRLASGGSLRDGLPCEKSSHLDVGRTGMAVSKLICPECKKVLKPTKPLPEGKKVTCPKCGANFAAKEPPPDPAAHPTKKAAAPAAPKPTAVKKAQQASKPIRPIEQRRHNLDDDEDEDEGGVYDFAEQPDHEGPEVEYTPDMSIKDLRGPAQAMLVKPSNYLIMAGVVGFFGWLGFMVIVLIPIIFPLQEKQPDDKN